VVEPITSKAQMYELYERGCFGNRPRFWRTACEYYHAWGVSTTDFAVNIRCLLPSGPCSYAHSTPCHVAVELFRLDHAGYDLHQFIISEMAPYECQTIQGELMRTAEGLSLLYTDVRAPMRPALKERTLYATGLQALMLLRAHVDPVGVDWLLELLDTYVDHVVEFTAFERAVGVLQQPWIVWELRKY
jgi:hypothetical protein